LVWKDESIPKILFKHHEFILPFLKREYPPRAGEGFILLSSPFVKGGLRPALRSFSEAGGILQVVYIIKSSAPRKLGAPPFLKEE